MLAILFFFPPFFICRRPTPLSLALGHGYLSKRISRADFFVPFWKRHLPSLFDRVCAKYSALSPFLEPPLKEPPFFRPFLQLLGIDGANHSYLSTTCTLFVSGSVGPFSAQHFDPRVFRISVLFATTHAPRTSFFFNSLWSAASLPSLSCPDDGPLQ